MNPKRTAFVQEYLVDLNGTQAAIRAGYSKKTARQQADQLLSKLDVQEALRAAMAARSERTQITADYVLYTIQDTVERCRQAQPVVGKKGEPVFTQTPDGELAPAYTFDAQAVLKGAELLGKHLKLFTDKVDLTSSDGSMTPTVIERRIVDHTRD